MKKLTKIIALCIVLFQLVLMTPPTYSKYTPGEKRMLMVSAYYSPLPNQRFYMRGSFEADKILNGRGTNGADGTEVYVGMIAAPRTIPFGTRIRIPGLGVGEVHDRGGAIKSYNRYERIDVWMGHGEDGLSRALNWGMRLVEGEIYYTAHQVQPGLSYKWVSPQLPKSTLNRLMNRTLINPKVFDKPITKASPKASINELQEALRMFGYYRGPVTGMYDDATREAVKMFQLAEGVVQNENAVGIGYFGPQTRQALSTKSENFNSKIVKEKKRLEDNLSSLTAGLGKKNEGEEVYSIQQMLWELGYYKGDLHGKYNNQTIDAVYRFQKDHDVIAYDWDSGAGYYGKKTHTALVAAVDKRMEKLTKYPVQMQVWVPAKIDLPKLTNLDDESDFRLKNGLSFDLDIKKTVKKNPKFTQTLSINDKGEQVFRLQNVLIDERHLMSGLNTGYFGYKTQEALVQFQIAKGVVKRVYDKGAGVVGPRTRDYLNNKLQIPNHK